jgi:hypothetical protein
VERSGILALASRARNRSDLAHGDGWRAAAFSASVSSAPSSPASAPSTARDLNGLP